MTLDEYKAYIEAQRKTSTLEAINKLTNKESGSN